MLDVVYDERQLLDAVEALVPSHQRVRVISLVKEKDISEEEYESNARELLGESRPKGGIALTNADLGPSAGKAVPVSVYIKKEIYDLFCTNSQRYRDERKEGAATVRNLITIVATAVAGNFSLPLGVVVGAVTLCLTAVLKIGTNAYCEANKALATRNE
ncbi:hypothetical protein [Cupriavidus sp. USMAA2-4]|uniref:hypothetical protein n=1 Tax=Cupriavidus sp. USMAA2-4 TaxID=876364 RepID=UPI0012F4980B|nr:hypothetical protein [Cupriavidus sp. USMAA2-4]